MTVMTRRRPSALLLVAILLTLLVGALVPASPSSASPTVSGATDRAPGHRTCGLPTAAHGFAHAGAASVQLDPAKLQRAMDYANTHLRLSVQVFRHNCLVAEGAGNRLTRDVPYNVWSSTKSVISLLTGIAIGRGDLRLNAPIGRYLPRGYGDRAHRAITVRDLLTETSGLDEAIASEAATTGTDPNVAREALAQRLTRTPGTHFRYSQRTPDLLAFVVQRAVHEDLQTFARRHLFAPIGIGPKTYFWLRDRSGHTYGYAHLFIAPSAFARLGLLMQHGGRWRGHQVVPASYLRQASHPTRTNGCYGYLFWTNGGTSCTGASVPGHAETIHGHVIPNAPHDTFAMVGAFQQNNFAIPSLGITVTWTGFLGDTTFTNLPELLSAGPSSDLYDNFFRLLMRAVRDRHVPDRGPLKQPVYFDVNPVSFASPTVLLHDLFPSRGCTIVVCDGAVPTRGTRQDLAAILNVITPQASSAARGTSGGSTF